MQLNFEYPTLELFVCKPQKSILDNLIKRNLLEAVRVLVNRCIYILQKPELESKQERIGTAFLKN